MSVENQAPRLPDVELLLDARELPESVRRHIRATLAASNLRPTERVDVARELIAHFEDGLAAGGTPEALVADFGDGQTAAKLIRRAKREYRDSRKGTLADRLVLLAGNCTYAARRLRQSPGFTVTAVLSLALGIGANTAIFSVVNSLLLSDVSAARPAELVEIYESNLNFPYNVFSYPTYLDFREGSADVFADVSASILVIGMRDTAEGVETILAEAVSGTYFPLLEISPAVGRLLGPEDDIAHGAHPVVVLSYSLWQRGFGADPGVVGNDLVLSGLPYTVVGVAPEQYRGMTRGLNPDVFISAQMADTLEGAADNRLEQRGNHSTFVRGRLRDGTTIETAGEVAKALATRVRAEHPNDWGPDDAFRLKPTREVVLFPMFDGPITVGVWLMLGVVGLVLLIACANLASFLLARAVDRRKEIAVRLALGARRSNLVAQLLTETVMLSLLGGVAGVGVATWSVGTLSNLDMPFPVPLRFDFAVDATVLLFSLAISVAAGMLFGLAPALQATRPDLVSTLRDEAAGGGQGGRNRLRRGLVIAQVAVSVVLLVGAGLFLRSLQAIYAFDPGFGAAPAAILKFAIPDRIYDDATSRTLLNELEREVDERPDVTTVGLVTNLHLEQANTTTFSIRVDGVPAPEGYEGHAIDLASTTSGFFGAVGIPIVGGRNFDTGDNSDGDRVAIVNEAFSERFWPGEDAIGRVFRSAGTDEEWRIVGVAADAKIRTLGEMPRPFIYLPLGQSFSKYLTLVAATRGTPGSLPVELIAMLRERAPEALVYQSHTMQDHLEVVRFPSRIAAVMFSFFAALALALATIGLYGLVSYTQAQRTREVGIRMSLGADARSVVTLLIRSGMRLVLIGVFTGVVLALGMARVVGGLLFGVGTSDIATFVTVVALLGGVALVAAWVPARRASRVDPVQALRSE